MLLRDEWLRLLAADDGAAAAGMRGLVWRGVPASIRCRVWLHLLRSRMPAADMAAYHRALQDRLRRQQPAAFADIEKDVTRTLPAVWLFRTAEGVAALRRLLLCFSLHSPAIGYCFSELDTRILTSHGLLFLEQVEALQRAGREVLFGCYDVQSKALLYSKGKLVFPQRPPPYLVEFTSAGEAARWAEGSGECGTEGAADDGPMSGRVSLRVTPGHDLFVQLGSRASNGAVHWSSTRGRPDSATERAPPAAPEPHRKVQAQDLLSADPRAYVRLLACAQAGYAPQATSQRRSVQRDLHLDVAQFAAFIELLGFWLGNGSLAYEPAVNGSAAGWLTFSPVKQADLSWLRGTLKEADLKEDEHWLTGRSCTVTTLYLREPTWFAFFEAEFGSKSVQHLPDWALQELSAAEMRRLISGLQRADGSFAAAQSAVCTASAHFRDQLMQALLHCGYSAYAGLMHRKGDISGYELHEQSSDTATCSVSFFAGLHAKEQLHYRPILATADSWKVSWAEVGDGRISSSLADSCWPSLSRQQHVTKVPYNAERDGRTWCVEVEHADHLILAQRAHRDADGAVTRQSRPIVVGNCQGLNFIAASLLLVSEGDECAAFSLLCGLVDGRVGYYTRSMAACVVDTAVMSDLAEFFEPELHALLLSHGLPITSFCSSWLICLFCHAPLSLPHAMRVWDALICIGDEVLFRLGLALLRHSHTRLLAVSSAEELLQLFLQQLGDIADLEPLMRHVQAQCQQDPFLSLSIASLRQFHQYEMAAEQSRLPQSSVLRLQETTPFTGEELQQLWSLFLQPQPWQTIVTGAIQQLTHFRFSFCAAVFQPAASQRFKGRGLILPAHCSAQQHSEQQRRTQPDASAVSAAASASPAGAASASASPSSSSSLPASFSILESRAANFLLPEVGQSPDSLFAPAGSASFSSSALLSPRSTLSSFPWWASPAASPTASSPTSSSGPSASSLPLPSPPSSPKSRAPSRRAVLARRRASSSVSSEGSVLRPPASASSSRLLPASFSAHRALLAASSLITAATPAADEQQPSFPADLQWRSSGSQAAAGQPPLGLSSPCLPASAASVAYAASDNVLARLFVMLDGGGRGCVEFDEFCLGVAIFRRSSRAERLRAAFSMADVDGDGQLSRPQLARFVSMLDRLYQGQRAAASAELQAFVSAAFDKAAPSQLLNCSVFAQVAPLQPSIAAFFRLDAGRESSERP